MAYVVNLTARAERDLEHLHAQVHAESSEAARKWYRNLKEAILSLEEHPNRCPMTSENPTLRNLLYGDKPNVYRVIYQIAEKRKEENVLHVRHGATGVQVLTLRGWSPVQPVEKAVAAASPEITAHGGTHRIENIEPVRWIIHELERC